MASPGGGGVPTHGGGGSSSYADSAEGRRLDQTRAQVDEVVVIMRSNVEKVMERESKLNELDLRADALQAGANQFQRTAVGIRRKYWWQNVKMMIILGAVIVVIIVIIAVSIGVSSGSSD